MNHKKTTSKNKTNRTDNCLNTDRLQGTGMEDCGSDAFRDCSDCSDCCNCSDAEPLPESARPRKDGPGGEGKSEE